MPPKNLVLTTPTQPNTPKIWRFRICLGKLGDYMFLYRPSWNSVQDAVETTIVVENCNQLNTALQPPARINKPVQFLKQCLVFIFSVALDLIDALSKNTNR